MKPDDETVNWIFEAARWWLGCFGSVERTLVPSPDDFPVDDSLRGHALASAILDVAMQHTGLTEWPLVMTETHTPNIADVLKGMSHPMTSPTTSDDAAAGIIRPGEPLPIPYDASQLANVEALVATIARSISHYLLYSAPTPFPGEEDDRAYFVDLGAVLLGFGVFLANSAFEFEQTTEGMMIGWSYARRGALSELDLSYALALSVTLSDTPDKPIVKSLHRNPRSFFKNARKHIRKKRKTDLETLYTTVPIHDGPYR